MLVADILKAKSTPIVSIKPNATIAELCALISQRSVGAAVVSRDGMGIDGIVTERDIAYALAGNPKGLHAEPVSSIMTQSVVTCAPDDDAGRVASSMLSRRFRHIPVADNGRLVGMISIRDVLKERVEELQQQTAQLRTLALQPAALEDRG